MSLSKMTAAQIVAEYKVDLNDVEARIKSIPGIVGGIDLRVVKTWWTTNFTPCAKRAKIGTDDKGRSIYAPRPKKQDAHNYIDARFDSWTPHGRTTLRMTNSYGARMSRCSTGFHIVARPMRISFQADVLKDTGMGGDDTAKTCRTVNLARGECDGLSDSFSYTPVKKYGLTEAELYAHYLTRCDFKMPMFTDITRHQMTGLDGRRIDNTVSRIARRRAVHDRVLTSILQETRYNHIAGNDVDVFSSYDPAMYDQTRAAEMQARLMEMMDMNPLYRSFQHLSEADRVAFIMRNFASMQAQ